MKTDAATPFIIFSVTTIDASGTLGEANNIEECIASLLAFDITFKQLKGCHKGNSEVSFLINAEHEDVVKALCEQFRQERYLYVSPFKTADLRYLDTRKSVEIIGTFARVTESKAKETGSYSIDPETGQYWAVL